MYSVNSTLTGSEWDSRVQYLPDVNFLLSWAYVQAQQEADYKVFTFLIEKGAVVAGAYVAVLRPAKRGRYLEVAAPVLADLDQDAVQAAVLHLQKLAHMNSCVFVRIRPQLLDSDENRNLLKQMGMRRAHMHLYAEYTSIVDLNHGEDELLANMRKQTRYEVRKAKKIGIKVTRTDDLDAYKDFYKMQLATAERQGFVLGSNPKLLEAEYSSLSGAGQATLYQAQSSEGQLLNMAMIVNYGEEVDYMYGSSTEAGQKLPGAYAIQWRALTDAKKQGFKRYNMWGIAPSAEPKHRFAGVTTFKKGFGGHDVSYVPAHDLIINKTKYRVTQAVEYIRKKRRNL